MAYKFNPFTGTLDYYASNNSTPYILTTTYSTASVTLVTGDLNKISYLDYNGDRTATLPAAPADGSWLIIADADRSGYAPTNYVINILAGAGDTLVGGVSPLLSTNQSVQLIYVASLLQWIAV